MRFKHALFVRTFIDGEQGIHLPRAFYQRAHSGKLKRRKPGEAVHHDHGPRDQFRAFDHCRQKLRQLLGHDVASLNLPIKGFIDPLHIREFFCK